MGLGPSHPIGLLGPTGPLLGLYLVNPDRNPNPLAPTPPHVATPPPPDPIWIGIDPALPTPPIATPTAPPSSSATPPRRPSTSQPPPPSLGWIWTGANPPDPVARRRDDPAAPRPENAASPEPDRKSVV